MCDVYVCVLVCDVCVCSMCVCISVCMCVHVCGMYVYRMHVCDVGGSGGAAWQPSASLGM